MCAVRGCSPSMSKRSKASLISSSCWVESWSFFPALRRDCGHSARQGFVLPLMSLHVRNRRCVQPATPARDVVS